MNRLKGIIIESKELLQKILLKHFILPYLFEFQNSQFILFHQKAGDTAQFFRQSLLRIHLKLNPVTLLLKPHLLHIIHVKLEIQHQIALNIL